MSKSWRTVYTAQSESNGNVYYRVNIDEKGEVSCTCPGWTFKKRGKPRGCKHITAYLAGLQSEQRLARKGPVRQETQEMDRIMTSGKRVLRE